jgi:diguanylate cyclase (GGDEF)-like protein
VTERREEAAGAVHAIQRARGWALLCLLLGYALLVSSLYGSFGEAVLALGLIVSVAAGALAGARTAVLVAAGITAYDVAFVTITGHGTLVWCAPRALAALAVQGAMGAVVGRLHDLLKQALAARTKAERAATFLASHDPVTALPTRPVLEERLELALNQARREKKGLAVLLIDLDRFKTVNESLGRDAGDSVLRAVAERLQACLRGTDTVARLGGDELVVIAPTVAGPEAATLVATKVLRAIEAPALVAGQEVRLTASVGVALFPGDAADGPSLLVNADLALARAKEQGRRTFQIFSKAMSQPARHRLDLERSLRRAIERDELVAYFQPQVDLRSGRISGMEALVRWKHPERGMVPPNEFIPIAEDSGLIVPLGEWVLEAACRQARLWHTQGFPGLRVAVNLSVVQLRESDLAQRFAAILARTGLDPRFLELEITEALVARNDQNTREQLARLRDMGVQLAIDDFGTGYSSLAYLTRLPIDCLKIDRSFVNDLQAGSNTEAVVRAILAIARSLHLRVVAEGVETEAQRELLVGLGAQEMQGFLFSRPLPDVEATALLTSHRAHDANAATAVAGGTDVN